MSKSTTRRRIKSPTGCRPDQLMGNWMIEPKTFEQLYALAMSVDLVRLGEVNAKRLRADKFDDDDDEEEEKTGLDSGYENVGGIAMLDLSGPMTKYVTSFQSMMGGISTVRLRAAIRTAMNDSNVMGAMICVDSPGGTVDGTQALAADLAAISAAKPCMAFIDGLGCSAAYWAASQCSMVYASATSLVGSIGTRMRLEDTSGRFEQKGVVAYEITTGKMKSAGAPGTKVTDDQIAYYQEIADSTQAFFSEAVQMSRGLSAEQMKTVSDGRVFIAGKALELKLIDKVATADEAMAALRQRIFFGARA